MATMGSVDIPVHADTRTLERILVAIGKACFDLKFQLEAIRTEAEAEQAQDQ